MEFISTFDKEVGSAPVVGARHAIEDLINNAAVEAAVIVTEPDRVPRCVHAYDLSAVDGLRRRAEEIKTRRDRVMRLKIGYITCKKCITTDGYRAITWFKHATKNPEECDWCVQEMNMAEFGSVVLPGLPKGTQPARSIYFPMRAVDRTVTTHISCRICQTCYNLSDHEEAPMCTKREMNSTSCCRLVSRAIYRIFTLNGLVTTFASFFGQNGQLLFGALILSLLVTIAADVKISLDNWTSIWTSEFWAQFGTNFAVILAIGLFMVFCNLLAMLWITTRYTPKQINMVNRFEHLETEETKILPHRTQLRTYYFSGDGACTCNDPDVAFMNLSEPGPASCCTRFMHFFVLVYWTRPCCDDGGCCGRKQQIEKYY